MIPSPRRTLSQPPAPSSWNDLDDDEGWQDMPVVRSDENPFGLDEEDQKKYHYKPPDRLDAEGGAAAGSSNATGAHIELEGDTLLTDSWREKVSQDESDYTRLRLDEDEESEEVHMRTRYLFDEDKAMTPLSQMQATKELLTEGQRIAYVGLCQLIARRMVKDTARGWEGLKIKGKGKAKEQPQVESANLWMLKIMARLYQHMELEVAEQRMIESLAEHGVDAADLVPALMATHTVKNPEFDPEAKKRAEAGELDDEEDEVSDTETEAPPPPYEPRVPTPPSPPSESAAVTAPISRRKVFNPFGDDEDEEELPVASSSSTRHTRPTSIRLPSFDDEEGDIGSSTPTKSQSSFALDEDDGDIGRSTTPVKSMSDANSSGVISRAPLGDVHNEEEGGDLGRSSTPIKPRQELSDGESASLSADDDASRSSPRPTNDTERTPTKEDIPLPQNDESELPPNALPALPGVSTSLTAADEVVTLDIRWTVLCDLFLVLIADSIYDARSRVFLERLAEALGFTWLDVVRFENRITDALEIQESLEKTEQGTIIEGRRKGALRKRYAMMGLAAVGGGLVIGLSAGLMAPLIGAGLGAALATVGVTGTTGFLAGVGGAAVITTTGVLTGANIAGRGMARRTREVRTFELRPMHNNQRVSCYITVGGFTSGKYDDVRLPFSVMDPVVGDVVSVYWEPEMMGEMGAALKILTSEILSSVGQQVLAATVMTALMSALQWPIILTKLGYLIDNPWSNALDRARAAGLVLADTIIHRHAGVRPVSLIGFSLGARAIFYALIELARVKAFGLVQDVFLFGTTVTASRQTWLDIRSAVGGRFVNGYATNDWMLGYLFRATSGGLNTVAGLRPVEGIPGLENEDVTEIITGHMSYRSCMPQLLARVGFPVTAEYFDEPEDPDVDMSVQERRIVNEAEEEAKKNRGKILGIFPRRAGSGSNTPIGRKSADLQTKTSAEYDEGDELPPREEADLGTMAPSTAEVDLDPKEREELERRRKAEEEAQRAEERALAAIPKTAGFDFSAISKELGKEIDLAKLDRPEPRREQPSPLPSAATFPPERSGSAPPISVDQPSNPPMGSHLPRSMSYAPDEDDEGDITFASNQASKLSLNDMGMASSPWDQPRPSSVASVSPPVSSTSAKSPAFNFGFNAWSTPANAAPPAASGMPLRAAPPARPHPAELMANPFASTGPAGGFGASNGFGSEKAGWKKDEELATNNPW